ncbi:MAG: glycine oxidase ThiO [Gammaproteobacteria bacterium]|nr:glycine oxidase ThiO [Gammaproteobacteria bacterium]
MKQALIIGAGAVGLLTAYCLRQYGWQVTVLDQHTTGSEASWAGGGILSPLYPWRQSAEINQLAHYSAGLYAEWEKSWRTDGYGDIEYLRSGMLVLDAANEQALVENWAVQYQQAITWHSHPETQWPGVALMNQPALYLPQVSQIRPPRLLKTLVNVLRAQGVDIQEHQTVRRLKTSAHGCEVMMADGTQKTADVVIVAAGAWTGSLLATIGIEIPIKPVYGEMLCLQSPVKVPCMMMRDGFYLIPRQDGSVLVGSTLEDRGFDKTLSDDGEQQLRRAAQNILPALKQAVTEHHWAGLRPSSPSGIPWIGAVAGVSGLYINSGHFRNGLVMAAGSASLLADQLEGKQPALSLDHYHW